MKDFEDLARQINFLHYDIRAEVIINNLLKNDDFELEDFIIEKEGQFSRAYRYDILESELGIYNYNKACFLKLLLSRDSIYDMLPENVIHNINTDSEEKNVDVMIGEYRKKKQEQKNSRLFFQPFENEIFNYGVKIEEFEQNFFCELNGLIAPELLYEIFGINKNLSPEMTTKLIRILPYVYKIVGNLDLITKILFLLLGEEVKIRKKNWKKYYDYELNSQLGSCKLGLDMVSGNNYDHYLDYLSISIGPLKKSAFSDYIHKGEKKQFLDLIYSFLFSAETEIETEIIVSIEKENFNINTYEDTFLGFNTRI